MCTPPQKTLFFFLTKDVWKFPSTFPESGWGEGKPGAAWTPHLAFEVAHQMIYNYRIRKALVRAPGRSELLLPVAFLIPGLNGDSLQRSLPALRRRSSRRPFPH